MCGIVGVASSWPVKDRDWLAQGRDALRHRGPDDAGEWWSADGRVGLGHRRLAILDLSPAGHQPMLDERGELVVVYNGEIYNFRELRTKLEGRGHCFRSQSDTEVLLAAYREWGVTCLERLNGMFAFALYDQRNRQLFLARDRAGEKPLFYWLGPGEFRFASELKGLLADPTLPRRLDSEALDCYLAFGFVPGDRCILRGMRKLPPAHALVFDLETGTAQVWRYWDLPPVAEPHGRTVDEVALVDELECLLADAVRRQLVADVPVGILLSGGMDSSLVTSMAVRRNARVKTFTVRFPGYGPYDETEHARLVARHFGTEHVELDAAEATPDLLPRLARQFDEPVVDSSMIPTSLLCQVVRQHCTVALGGDGGDELFGGYAHYPRLVRFRQYAGWIPLSLRRAVAAGATAVLPVGLKGRNWLQAFGEDFVHGVPLIASYFDRRTRARLLDGAAGRWPHIAEEVRQEAVRPEGDLIERATRADFRLYLAEDILVKVDRASMLHSLEVRAPFLDYGIVEFAFGKVPSRLKAGTHGRKILLRRLAARVLPAGFDTERKQGFSIPLGSWLRSGPWLQFFREVLLDANEGLFDRRCLEHMLDGQARGRSNSERLFALVIFELWRREYGVSV
jgi:asparagine synthase (glutamine-hydrolysing)